MAHEFIYTCYKLARHYPPDRTVLENISLSFYPGAKIGVIGSNGAGKSSLLKIMAGLDDGFSARRVSRRASPSAICPRSRSSTPTRTSRATSWRASPRSSRSSTATTRSWRCGPTPTPTTTRSASCRPTWRTRSRRPTRGASNATSRSRWTRCGARPTMPTSRSCPAVRSAASRSAVCCSAVRTCCCSTSRRTTSTPSRCTGWSGSCRTTTARSSRSPTTGTSSTTSRSGSSSSTAAAGSRSRATTRRGSSRRKPASPSRRSRTTPAVAHCSASSSGCACRPRRARRRARPASPRTRSSRPRPSRPSRSTAGSRSPSRPGRASATRSSRCRVTKAFGDKLLFEDLAFTLPPAGIVGVIGPNGAGKTTLFRMLVGQETPDAGTIKVGDTVKMSYVDQSRDHLDPDKSVYEEITEGVEHMKVGNREIHGRAYCASFNFKGTDQQKPVGKLSGGERNRVHLAKLLKSGGNVLLLDEPTNDLDVDTLRALEAGLESFPGCAVVISHDRWFLDRIATHVLAFEGDSVVRWFEGNFTEYEEYKKRELGENIDQPHRIKYRKLA